jgi:hypothetical protein
VTYSSISASYEGFGWCAEREVREGGVGAPRRDGGGGDVQADEQVAGGEKVAEGGGRASA